eukprot:gene1148-1551_t
MLRTLKMKVVTIFSSGVARSSGFPLHHHNVFFSPDSPREFGELVRHRSVPGQPTVYVCAQDRGHAGLQGDDQGLREERLMCLVNAPADGDSRPIGEEELSRCETAMRQTLARSGLVIHPSGPPIRATTPSDFERLFPGTGGALYGPASHGWRASFARPGSHSRLPGLYLAGGSTHPGPGLPMAVLSGRLAAQSLLQDLARSSTRPSRPAHALVVIAFIGSVFSPYYAWAHRRAEHQGGASPLNHCAVNVALYGPAKGWAMTERGHRQLQRSATHLQIGPSQLRWVGDMLELQLDETTTPWPRRLRGTVRLHPAGPPGP